MSDEIPYYSDKPEIIDILKEIAYINVKKTSGNSTTHFSTLESAYKENKTLLFGQINKINPSIIIYGGTYYLFENDIEEKGERTHEGKVDFTGKVAKFPKNTKASKAYNFLENVKVSKKSIWYIMVEKQDNELQMVKYNVKEGVDLSKFVNELKTYYTKKYGKDAKFIEAISKISVDGNDKYSMVKNIPLVEVEGKKMITRITEDLIKLLSK
jgi:hypothetical protein